MAEHKKSIFVVEDNDDLRSLLLELFEKEGYEVAGASDGGVAQDLLKQKYFDLVLLDLGLPTVGGLEILQGLQHKADGPKVIVMTGDDTTQTILELVRGQTCHLISKPAPRTAYLEAVEHALAQTSELLPIEIVSAKADWVELLVPCQLEVVDCLQSFILGMNAKLSKEVRESIGIAFRELLMNAIEWGGKLDASRKVRIACLRSDRILQYRIQDPGPGFKPDDLKHAAVTNDPEHPYAHMAARAEKGIRAGGFGLLMTHTLVDELIYNEAHNEVVFIKYL
jgi:CheY-like chemotaxis protein/anti-sigma regulatory factor (Ser/Thr protein kinase)